jgi:hypothetical protein
LADNASAQVHAKCTQGSAVKCPFRHGYQDFEIDHGADFTDIKLDDDETFQPATGCSIGILRLKQAKPGLGAFLSYCFI